MLLGSAHELAAPSSPVPSASLGVGAMAGMTATGAVLAYDPAVLVTVFNAQERASLDKLEFSKTELESVAAQVDKRQSALAAVRHKEAVARKTCTEMLSKSNKIAEGNVRALTCALDMAKHAKTTLDDETDGVREEASRVAEQLGLLAQSAQEALQTLRGTRDKLQAHLKTAGSLKEQTETHNRTEMAPLVEQRQAAEHLLAKERTTQDELATELASRRVRVEQLRQRQSQMHEEIIQLQAKSTNYAEEQTRMEDRNQTAQSARASMQHELQDLENALATLKNTPPVVVSEEDAVAEENLAAEAEQEHDQAQKMCVEAEGRLLQIKGALDKPFVYEMSKQQAKNADALFHQEAQAATAGLEAEIAALNDEVRALQAKLKSGAHSEGPSSPSSG